MEDKVYDQNELPLYSTYCFKRDWLNKNGMVNQATALINKWYDCSQVFVIANNLMIYLVPTAKVKDMDEFWNWCKRNIPTSSNHVDFNNWPDFYFNELKDKYNYKGLKSIEWADKEEKEKLASMV